MSAIVAIDPGTTQSAIVEMKAGVVTYHNRQSNDWVLGYLRSIHDWRYQPTIVIEMVESYGMRFVGEETYETCVWVGRFIQVLQPLPVERLRRSDVKLHLLGARRGKDPDVRTALVERFGGKAIAVGTKAMPGPLFGVTRDRWAALAVAVTWADQHPEAVAA